MAAEFSEEEKKKFVEKLNRKGAREPCPRCRHTRFILVDGFFPFHVHGTRGTFGTLIGGGPVVPAIAAACGRCGWLAFHAMGILEFEGDNIDG